ncbi:MAG TPA: hypothetical protein VIN02_05685 [Sulfurovum sp.]
MRSKIIFVVLLMLSFTIFHDLFISVIEKNDHTKIVYSISDEASSCDTTTFNKIHSMFHFMAIMITYDSTPIPFNNHENIPHHFHKYSAPFTDTSHKPPIV